MVFEIQPFRKLFALDNWRRIKATNFFYLVSPAITGSKVFFNKYQIESFVPFAIILVCGGYQTLFTILLGIGGAFIPNQTEDCKQRPNKKNLNMLN